ncbi:MAG: FAD-dependent oxidoreductase [Thermoplasmata archaeon]
MAEDFDAIVVGAGMAGSSAAIRLAQAGANVLLVERASEPGAKNLSGGVLWGRDLDRILPRWAEEMPIERHVVRKRFGFLSPEGAVAVDFEDERWKRAPHAAHTVLRARTDAWLAKQAEAAGATVVSGVPVERLAWEGTTVRGIVQDGETMHAPVTIVADGANSRLSLGTPIRPATRLESPVTELGIKEVYRLPTATIEDRFNLAPGEGHAEEWVAGHLPARIMGGGFLYTNRDTLSLGLIVNIGSLFGQPTPSHELIERFKLHPAIQSRLRGAELVEYGAKLISSGWASRPAAFSGSGWMIVGDAAGFVFSNGIVIQGMNYAVRSGLEAAETALAARAAGDASAARLHEYDDRLDRTGILGDFRDFAAMDRVKWNPRFYTAYPGFAVELFHTMMSEDSGPKKAMRAVLREARRRSGVRTSTLIRDGIDLLRYF